MSLRGVRRRSNLFFGQRLLRYARNDSPSLVCRHALTRTALGWLQHWEQTDTQDTLGAPASHGAPVEASR